jgi:hypothetical protein
VLLEDSRALDDALQKAAVDIIEFEAQSEHSNAAFST